MDFDLPAELVAYLAELDAFIDARDRAAAGAERQPALLRPSPRMGAHRLRGAAACRAANGRRCSPKRGGAPTMPGIYRFALPRSTAARTARNLVDGGDPRAPRGQGPRACTTTCRTSIRSSPTIPFVLMCATSAAPAQQRRVHARHARTAVMRIAFGLTEPKHGSDATHMETRAVRETRDGAPAGASTARRCGPPACTSPRTAWCSPARAARPATRSGISAFLVPADTPTA